MVEIIVGIAITSILALYINAGRVQEAREKIAESGGSYLQTVSNAVYTHILLNFNDYANSVDVPNVANDLQPTLGELVALQRLNAAFPVGAGTMPGNQSIDVNIVRQNCPGVNCQLVGLVCTLTPYSDGETVRFDLASSVVSSQKGSGGQSLSGNGSRILGPNVNLPNPRGNVEGIVCGTTLVDTALYQRFLTLGDNRDPGFRGGVTVSGNTVGTTYTLVINGNANVTGTQNIIGNLNVGGASTFGGTVTVNGPLNLNDDILLRDPLSGQTCVRILRSGRVDINSVVTGTPACQGALNARIATLTDAGGQTARVGDTGTGFIVDANGRIRGSQGFWTAVGSLFGDNTLGIRVAGTVFTIQTGAGVDAVAVHDLGRLGARTSLSTPVLGLTDPVAIGQVCVNPATEVPATNVTVAATTAIRALIGGGFASCVNGQWSPAGQIGVIGGFCPTDGLGAFTSAGVLLICSGNQYVSMAARFGRLTTAEFWRVADGQSVPKPVCASGSSGTKLILTAGNEEQRTQRLNRSLQDTGAAWTVFMRDGLNAVIDGDMIATSYCIY